MYPPKRKCLSIETMGSYSKAVIGILLITLTLTIGLSILGVWDDAENGIQQDNNEMPFIPDKQNPSDDKVSEEISSETKASEVGFSEISENSLLESAISGPSDVPVPEGGCFGPFDTVRGTMTIVDSELPTDPLPLCIDDAYLDDWSLTVQVTGGYEFEDGIIFVKQGTGDKQECRGMIRVISDDGQVIDCITKQYVLTFELWNSNYPICLESNHVPASPLGDFWVCPDKTLDKEVYLSAITTWSGCMLEEQEFLVMLAHKVMSHNPQLSMRNTSPVLK